MSNKKIKEIKEDSSNPIAERINKEFNMKRKSFLADFRKNNDTEMIKRLYEFMRLHDDVTIESDGVYAFGAFGKDFFQGPAAPGQTGLEMYATEKYAQQYMKEYMSHIFSALLVGDLESSNKDKKIKAYSTNDIEDKE